eukprot:m.5754 g.5754  ORF g.5754 m.5754 type:complete len:742 (+) comp3392_c0_seq1:62-2287(+)
MSLLFISLCFFAMVKHTLSNDSDGCVGDYVTLLGTNLQGLTVFQEGFSTASSLLECVDICRTHSECVTMAFSATNSQCLLYSNIAATNNADFDLYIVFPSCFTTSVSTTTDTITTTKSTNTGTTQTTTLTLTTKSLATATQTATSSETMARGCLGDFFGPLPGKGPGANLIEMYNISSLEACHQLCATEPRCEAFSYRPRHGARFPERCQLYDTSSVENVRFGNRYMHYSLNAACPLSCEDVCGAGDMELCVVDFDGILDQGQPTYPSLCHANCHLSQEESSQLVPCNQICDGVRDNPRTCSNPASCLSQDVGHLFQIICPALCGTCDLTTSTTTSSFSESNTLSTTSVTISTQSSTSASVTSSTISVTTSVSATSTSVTSSTSSSFTRTSSTDTRSSGTSKTTISQSTITSTISTSDTTQSATTQTNTHTTTSVTNTSTTETTTSSISLPICLGQVDPLECQQRGVQDLCKVSYFGVADTCLGLCGACPAPEDLLCNGNPDPDFCNFGGLKAKCEVADFELKTLCPVLCSSCVNTTTTVTITTVTVTSSTVTSNTVTSSTTLSSTKTSSTVTSSITLSTTKTSETITSVSSTSETFRRCNGLKDPKECAVDATFCLLLPIVKATCPALCDNCPIMPSSTTNTLTSSSTSITLSTTKVRRCNDELDPPSCGSDATQCNVGGAVGDFIRENCPVLCNACQTLCNGEMDPDSCGANKADCNLIGSIGELVRATCPVLCDTCPL